MLQVICKVEEDGVERGDRFHRVAFSLTRLSTHTTTNVYFFQREALGELHDSYDAALTIR